MRRSDVIILGGGLIGLALAAALDSSGLGCIVIDPVDPDSWRDAKFDGRTSAVSSSSRRMLDAIGVGAHFAEPGCPIRTIRVADGLSAGALAFEPPEGDDEPLGWMHENRHLRAALKARAEAGEAIDLHWKSRAAPSSAANMASRCGSTMAASCTRPCWRSPKAATRRAARRRASASPAGNMTMPRSSRSSRHERPHEHIAWEIFYPGGPFALLPMTDDEAEATARRSSGRCRRTTRRLPGA